MAIKSSGRTTPSGWTGTWLLVIGAHVRMRVGETRHFRVVTQPGFYTGWTRPLSTNPHSVGLTAVRDPLRHGVSYNCTISGTIAARVPGSAVLFSSTDLPCFHAHFACLPPAVEWSVRVTVIPG